MPRAYTLRYVSIDHVVKRNSYFCGVYLRNVIITPMRRRRVCPETRKSDRSPLQHCMYIYYIGVILQTLGCCNRCVCNHRKIDVNIKSSRWPTLNTTIIKCESRNGLDVNTPPIRVCIYIIQLLSGPILFSLLFDL